MRVFAMLFCVGFVALLSAPAADFKPEDGFKMLLSGKNLAGWKTKTGEALADQAEAYKGRFKWADGELTIDPSVKGDVYIYTTDTTSGDVTIKFEYKPGKGCNNDLFLRGLKFDVKSPDVKNLKEGEWNQFEIVVKGKQAEFKNNGEVQKTLATKNDKSDFGIRAEFGSMSIRHLRIKTNP